MATPDEPTPDAEGDAASTSSSTPAPNAKSVKVVVPTKRRKRRRTWPQRLLLATNIIVILACFAGAGALLVARGYGNNIVRVDIDTPSADGPSAPATTAAPSVSTVPGDTTPVETGPPETFPEADPEAKNFLITGSDNNACVDPNSPYAGAFGDRSSMGERSDTIMVMRIDPSTRRGAVLSFPRDLWVKISGGRTGRINTAYVKDDPQRLIDTIWENFGVPIDHFIQVDFCAFKTIVDAVGGVAVPFEYPARDRRSGLNVPTKGCFTFDGDHALAYVRSRYYQYQTDDGTWRTDGVSDLGRISRQQDFLRRALTAALNQGITSPSVARGLIQTVEENIVVDRDLTITRMLEFVGVLRDVDPGGIATYQIEAVGRNISGQSVLEPRINGDNMQSILRIFKGEAPLAEAPEQVFDTTTTTTLVPAPTTTTRPTTGGTTTTTPSTMTTTTDVPVTEVPVVTEPPPEQNPKGIYPPPGVTC